MATFVGHVRSERGDWELTRGATIEEVAGRLLNRDLFLDIALSAHRRGFEVCVSELVGDRLALALDLWDALNTEARIRELRNIARKNDLGLISEWVVFHDGKPRGCGGWTETLASITLVDDSGCILGAEVVDTEMPVKILDYYWLGIA